MLKGYFARTDIGVFVFGLVIVFVSHSFASDKAELATPLLPRR